MEINNMMKKFIGLVLGLIVVGLIAITTGGGTPPPKQAAEMTNCYTVINSNLYDLAPWINEHPGGAEAIISLCGIDGTEAFKAQHSSNQKVQEVLQSFLVSKLN